MTLNFYYWFDGGPPWPLVASAYIPGDGNTQYPWPEGEVRFYEVNVENLPGGSESWKVDDSQFRAGLREELKEFIVVRNRESLKPWTRLAFENMAKYGIRRFPFACAKLIEDDGTEFDPANAIPLYGPNPGPVREDFRPPGRPPEIIAANQAKFEEVQKILRQRKLEKQKPVEPS